MMNEYNISVSFNENNTIFTNLIKIVQNDYNAYKLKFDFDKEFARALFKLKKPNDDIWVQEISNNELILPILVNEGHYEYEIAIYSNDGRLTNYVTEKFYVRSELISTDEVVESDDRVPILDNLINDVNTLENNITIAEENRNNAEQNRVSAENERNENEVTRNNNETTRNENEAIRERNETNRVNSEEDRETSENERKIAEISRNNNEVTRQDNETVRNNNEETRNNQEIAREEYITDFKRRVDEGEFDGECNFATFEIDISTGELVMHKTEDLLLDFDINNGYLEVLI